MIDIHSHILFGVDDGAGNAEDSLIMAETAAENGVKQMIMTPHCCEADGFANFNTAELLTRFDSMRAMMKENEIPLKLYNGMEVFSTPRLGEQIDEGKLLTLAGSKYLLIEFAFGETDFLSFGFEGVGSDVQKEEEIITRFARATTSAMIVHERPEPEQPHPRRHHPSLRRLLRRPRSLISIK